MQIFFVIFHYEKCRKIISIVHKGEIAKTCCKKGFLALYVLRGFLKNDKFREIFWL